MHKAQTHLANDLRAELGSAWGVIVDCARTRPTGAPAPEYLMERRVPCSDIHVYFDNEVDMRVAADRLRDDARVAKVTTQTMDEAYEGAKELFKDDPEMLELLRPNSIPAHVQVEPTPGVDFEAFEDELGKELNGVQRASASKCLALPHPVAYSSRE